METLNVLSSGMGQWGYNVVLPLLKITFPAVKIVHDANKSPDLVVLSHFLGEENNPFHCPYIAWSGESYRVKRAPHADPLCEINSFDCDHPASIYFPLLATDSKSIRPASNASKKKYCCAYAYTNPVMSRERLFSALRNQEKTCFSFGPSLYTPDAPFKHERCSRFDNGRAFRDFGFVFAMENVVQAGYITEKIGMAFEAGAVPIYDSRNGIDRFFNPASFFDVAEHTPESASQAIVNIWRDKHKLQKYLDAPIRKVDDALAQYENLNLESMETRLWMIPFVNALKEQFPDY